ncbi:MAG: hypothetical protein ACREC6_09415, partial [Hyphomicrobiaceae bacterium]
HYLDDIGSGGRRIGLANLGDVVQIARVVPGIEHLLAAGRTEEGLRLREDLLPSPLQLAELSALGRHPAWLDVEVARGPDGRIARVTLKPENGFPLHWPNRDSGSALLSPRARKR